MKIQLATSELQRLLPVSPGTAAHVRRVATLSREVGSRLPVSWRALSTLEQAALLHHLPERQREKHELPEDLAAVLRAFDGGVDAATGTSRLLSRVLLAADAVDQQLESLGWDPRPIETLWEELADFAGLVGGTVWKAVRAALRHPWRPPAGRQWPLPVNGQVVAEVVAALRRPEIEVPEMARLASRDPVLAGNVLAAANAAWFGRRSPARTVREAIAYIGPESGRRILLALTLRPLFGSARLAALWRHAVEMAAWCESLAAMTGLMDPAEAMLLGLIHDIGRVTALVRGSAEAYTRLIERGCPPLYTEQLLFGEGHGEIGADILESWGFAGDLAEAVRFHHHPAECESRTAAMLYLGEFWSAGDEDLPSARHLDGAQRRTGCSMETLALAGGRGDTLGDLSIVA